MIVDDDDWQYDVVNDDDDSDDDDDFDVDEAMMLMEKEEKWLTGAVGRAVVVANLCYAITQQVSYLSITTIVSSA